MSFKPILVLLCLLPLVAHAAPTCQYHDFLKNGIRQQDYKQCQALIQLCTEKGLSFDASCVKQTVANNDVCYQLDQIGQLTDGGVPFIVVEPQGQFALIDQIFPADGKDHYYIVSPQGCIVDTHMDPREFTKFLAKKFEKADFLLMNEGKPLIKNHSDGGVSFTTILKVTETCVACKVIGWARIEVTFAPNGKMTSTRLLNFSVKEKNPWSKH
jgi:hypothetical protein